MKKNNKNKKRAKIKFFVNFISKKKSKIKATKEEKIDSNSVVKKIKVNNHNVLIEESREFIKIEKK